MTVTQTTKTRLVSGGTEQVIANCTLPVPFPSQERDHLVELLSTINAESGGKFNTYSIKFPSDCFA